jgi:PKD repeat protein
MRHTTFRIATLFVACLAIGLCSYAQLDPTPPSSTVKLVFIHHSTGENWLRDVAGGDETAGGLGAELLLNNYFVSDTNYGWGPDSIGDRTDIGNWMEWFRGPHSATYLSQLYAEYGQTCWYSRLQVDPGGENEIVMFKSCFPNSNFGGNPSDPIPPIEQNPLVEQDSSSEHHTISNAKGIYIDLLNYFATRQDKLFIIILAPPLQSGDTSPEAAANARSFNDWMVNQYLAGYAYHNVFVFDFYTVLTSNGGNTQTNDFGASTGNHHRYENGQIQHVMGTYNNYSSYPSGDSHPTSAGGQKASGEFPALLNIAYHLWKGGSSVCALGCTATVPTTAQQDALVNFTSTATPNQYCTGSPTYDWDFGDGIHSTEQNPTHVYNTPGTFTWHMTATVGSTTCLRTGTIVVSGPVPGPTVDAVWRGGSPFKLKVSGANFDPGIQVFIGGDTSPWYNVSYRDSSYLILKGGGGLKARFPVGVPVEIRFVNSDGQEATYTYTR